MKREKLSEIISAIVLFFVGVLLFVYSDKILDWISVILGALAIAYAVITLLSHISAKPKDRREVSIFLVVLAAATGIVLISKSTFLREMISFIVGIYIILTSALQLSLILDFKRLTGVMIRSIILPIVGIILGALCVSGDLLVPDALTKYTGILLAIYSIIDIVSILLFSHAEKTVKTHAKIQEGEIVSEPSKSEKKSTKK
ncbi:DUF308 domain-containing protein [Candidatus Saccharibacteria bacterium]|nr:DUF308 domain-containing protein [Candidatus Saccharibacteria bacterium]